MSIATVLLFAGTAALAANMLLGSIRRNHDGPTELQSAEGRRIDSLLMASPELASWLQQRNDAHTWLMYVFRTDCPACASQKARVAASLKSLRSGLYVTASPEEGEAINTYWQNALPAPIHVSQLGLRMLGVPGVPALLVISQDSVVEEAWLGVIDTWPPGRIEEKLE
jgi:hypothetical protein